MLTHNINPVLFKIGFVQVSYYALVYVIGFLVALFLLLRAVRKREIDMKERQVYDLIILSVIGVIIGARLFHALFWNFSYFLNHPSKIFYIWQGGLSFHGGLLGAFIVIGLYCWRKKISFWKIADLFAFLGIIMPAFSRIANFINQEIVGTVTNVLWCFDFKYAEGCRHPVQLYASAGRFIFFFVLLGIKKKLIEYKGGFMFWSFIFGIGLGRFVLDFWRA